ncbi:MAG: hypothetical protein H0Z34_05645 [Brevibacillus sp.]|nr:hypothetical protein [Brevibacillus sp.]
MSDVIVIRGAVTYTITLDPGVWIFDERKIDLRTYQVGENSDTTEPEKYLAGTGAQWDRDLREGTQLPAERRSLVEERKVLEGDYGIKLAPFLDNAEPLPEARFVRIHRKNGEPVTIPLAEAREAILQFAKAGKPIRENGPVLFFLPETLKSKGQPIDGITAFELVDG